MPRETKLGSINTFRAISWLVLAIVLIIVVSFLVRYASGIYLDKAKKEADGNQRLIYAEQAVIFFGSEKTNLEAGNDAYKLGDYPLALHYFNNCQSDTCWYHQNESLFALGKYQGVIDHLAAKTSPGSDNNKLLMMSYLKLGKISEAREIVKLDPSLRSVSESFLPDPPVVTSSNAQRTYYSTTANLLTKAGFPQAAYTLLQEGFSAKQLDRNSLLTLAQAQITLNKYSAAKTTLEVALQADPYYPQTYRQLINVTDNLGLKNEKEKYQKTLASLTW
jgi:hypothetical protein